MTVCRYRSGSYKYSSGRKVYIKLTIPEFNLLHLALPEMNLSYMQGNMSIDQAFLMAVQFHQKGDYQEAEWIYQQILKVQPTHYLSLGNLGLISAQLKKNEEAQQYLSQSTAINSNYYEGHTNLGNLHFNQGQYEAAVEAYKKALSISPNDAEVWSNLAATYLRMEKDEESIICYQKAIEINPKRADLHNALGDCYYILKMYKNAIKSYHNSLRINPNQIKYCHNLGYAYQNLGKHSEAIKYYQKALNIDPKNISLHVNLATALLLTKDFKNGWVEYEWRRKLDQYRKFSYKDFTPGKKIEGKSILIYAEQGIGDTIQFMRFIPLIENAAGDITFLCPKPLQLLLEDWCLFSDRVKIISEYETMAKYDFCLPLMSLPYVLGIGGISEIPIAFPEQFSTDSSRMADFKKIGSGIDLKVGIVWAGNPNHVRDNQRSISLVQLNPLFNLPSCTFFSLQVGDARNELYQKKNLHFSTSIEDCGQDFGNFWDTAKIISKLDLVVSVDTAVAHLSATMNKPTWIMISANPDWRWLLNCNSSPWYPSVRLFRQKELGDWEQVISDIRKQILKKREK